MKAKIEIDSNLCKGCQFCIEFCPRGSIRLAVKLNPRGYAFAEFDPEQQCTGCATCALVCPEAAIEVYRE